MPNTTTWDIGYPDSSSAITPLESHFETLAVDTDEALTNLKANIRGSNSSSTIATLATDIATLQSKLELSLLDGSGAPTSTPAEGSLYWDTANDILYIYANGSWSKVWSRQATVLTNVTNPSLITAVNTAEWTINQYTYTEKNGMVNLSIGVKRKGGDLAGGNIGNESVFTLASGYRPLGDQAPGLGGSAGPVMSAYLSGSTGTGVITAIGTTISDESDINLNFVFIKE